MPHGSGGIGFLLLFVLRVTNRHLQWQRDLLALDGFFNLGFDRCLKLNFEFLQRAFEGLDELRVADLPIGADCLKFGECVLGQLSERCEIGALELRAGRKLP